MNWLVWKFLNCSYVSWLQVKRTSSWNKACEELKRHQNLLEKMRLATNNFTSPPPDTSSSESEVESDEVSKYKNVSFS